jgi:hypothetical protein
MVTLSLLTTRTSKFPTSRERILVNITPEPLQLFHRNWNQSISSEEANNIGSPGPFTRSTLSRCSLSTGRKTYLCAHCGKPRSSRYHESHPLVPGQTSGPGICSRPNCAQFKSQLKEDSYFPKPVIVEVHHYYHGSPDLGATANPVPVAEVSGESSLAGRVEVLGDLKHGHFWQTYGPGEVPPPPINRATKPTLHF